MLLIIKAYVPNTVVDIIKEIFGGSGDVVDTTGDSVGVLVTAKTSTST